MAKVLSSISGNLISAASAGYAPTNSGDVSAIASAYQVVSATGTQLYGGTAHVTSINGAPISASRAGYAVNARLATSAYYDGTGRLISSLPDSATVSSIASSYAPTFGLNAGKISSINGSALDTPTGTQVVTATGSSWIGGEIGISSINGSALSAKEAYSATRAAEDDFGASFRYDYAKQSAFSSVSSTVANNSASWGQGGAVSSPSGTIFVSGDNIEGTNSAVLTASSEPGFTTSFNAGDQIPSWTAQELYAGTLPGSGATLYIPIQNFSPNNTAIISGKDSNMAIITASGLASGTPLAIYLGTIVNAISASSYSYIHITGDVTAAKKEGGIAVTGVGELAWKSAVDNVTNTVASNSATWGQGGVDSATVSSIASSYAQSAASSKLDASAIGFGVNDGDLVASSISGKPIRAKYALYDVNGIYLSSYALSADVSGTVDTVSAQSANWGGSALALSAGPGVKLEKVGDTLVVSNDETVLFTGESFSATLSESIKNFSRMYVEYGPTNYYSAPLAWYNTEAFSANDVFRGVHLEFVEHNGANEYCFPKNTTFVWDAGFTSLNATGGLQYRVSGNAIQNELTGNQLYIRKIVGINRTAEA